MTTNQPGPAAAGLHLIPDSPIEDASGDRLDRMRFVRSFAEAVRAVRGVDSVVLALAGPWGSGKSSLLNLVAEELSTDPHPPLVVRFNPWWFTGTGRLVTAFLEQLGAAVARDEVISELGEAEPLMRRLASAIELPGGEGAEAGSRDIEALRARLNEIFRRSPRRVLIFMDDVDRLVPAEMTQLLLIVRAVADFPNTTFVLAFDHEVVSEAISDKLGVDGRTYLEKVVLLQIDVPLPGRMALEHLVMGQLQSIDPHAARLDEDAKRHFRILFEGGVRHFLATPRACTRMLNVVRFTYPMLVGQVYFPDMLGISCLMSFSSQAILAIRTDPEAFVGPCDPSGDGWVRLREHHLGWLDAVPPRDRSSVELIVRVLFPKVAWALNGPLRGDEYAELWDRSKRICSEKHFEAYFRLGVSHGEASEWRWRTMVDLLDDATAFAAALDRYGPLEDSDAGPTVDDLLLQATDYVVEQATPQQAASLFRAVLSRGDDIAAVNDGGQAHKVDFLHRIVSLLIECLARLEDGEERMHCLTSSVESDAGLLTAAELLDALDYRPQLLAPPEETDNPKGHTERLLRVLKLLDIRIQQAADSGELKSHPLYMRVAHKWWKFGRRTKAQRWILEATEDDEDFVSAIMQTAPRSDLEAAAIGPPAAGGPSPAAALPLEFLRGVFGRAKLRSRIQELLAEPADWLTDEANEILLSLASRP